MCDTTHAVSLIHKGKYIDFEFTSADDPLAYAMRYVLPQYRSEVTPVILGTYTRDQYDAIPWLYTDLIALADSGAFSRIGETDEVDSFVRSHYSV